MKQPISDIAFTPAVKAEQERRGSRSGYADMERMGGWNDRVTPELEQFIAQRDSFYIATAAADGRPYIQHRGGPPGFLKVLDDRTLAFADYGGNRQFITLGNLAENDQAFIFLMDYAQRRRIKVWGRAEVVEDDAALFARVADSDYRKGKAERVIRFRIEAWDVNCPAHIPRKYGAQELARATASLRSRVEALEAENRALRDSINAAAGVGDAASLLATN